MMHRNHTTVRYPDELTGPGRASSLAVMNNLTASLCFRDTDVLRTARDERHGCVNREAAT